MPKTKSDSKKLFELEHKKSIVPLDCALGIDKTPFKMTLGFISKASKACILANSYEDAVNDVFVECNVKISAAELERVTDYVGALAFNIQKEEAITAMLPESLKVDERRRRKRENDILYLMTDGAMLHYRDKPNAGDGWGECKSALCFHSRDIKYYKRKTDGEQAHKIMKMDHIGFIGSADDFLPHFLALAQRNECKVCSEVVIIIDGALWQFNRLKKY